MSQRKFTVSEDYAGRRLDVFLADKLPDLSRSWIQKLIKDGKVKINKQPVRASKKIKVGDKIVGTFELPPEISLEPDSSLDKKIQIVFENDDFVVLNKPTELVVHPSASTPKGTLVNWLLYKYPNIKKAGEDELRPGIVHRLDKDTSGLIVVAKTQETFGWLKQAFKDREVRKRYWALVHGVLKRDEGTIRYPVGRSRRDPTRQLAYKSKTQTPPTARQAVTHWRVRKHYADFTFVEFIPETGRMHQIRVHAKAIGHPVAGDTKYKNKEMRPPKNLGRMFLHAFALSFSSSNGQKFSFTIPLPTELERTLKNLPFMVK